MIETNMRSKNARQRDGRDGNGNRAVPRPVSHEANASTEHDGLMMGSVHVGSADSRHAVWVTGTDMLASNPPRICVVIPCYDEEQVLPLTAPVFTAELSRLMSAGKASPDSRIMLIDDGSGDGTWGIICRLAVESPIFEGIRLSRNRGHQNALLAGLMEARERGFDATVSMDADGQDDVRAMKGMLDAYADGAEVVYGVRTSRDTDTAFKRLTAHAFYRLMESMGVETIYNHADYRLLGSRALDALAEFREVNLYLRGMVPLLGYQSATVGYERATRKAGCSHYPLSKMLGLAIDGITSMSTEPIRLISAVGIAMLLVGLVGGIVVGMAGEAATWVPVSMVLLAIGGIQMIAIGIVGEYVGKAYMEAKARPRYVISERTSCGE